MQSKIHPLSANSIFTGKKRTFAMFSFHIETNHLNDPGQLISSKLVNPCILKDLLFAAIQLESIKFEERLMLRGVADLVLMRRRTVLDAEGLSREVS